MNTNEESRPEAVGVPKVCAYCGKENSHDAAFCKECGTTEFNAVVRPSHYSTSQTITSRIPTLAEVVADPAKLFRGLVVVAHGCYFISCLVPLVDYRFMAYETLEALNLNGLGRSVTLSSGISWLIVAIYLPIAIGLYQFSASARTAFTVLTVGFTALSLFLGIMVVPAHVAFLNTITIAADGAIFLLAYTSPLKERFR